MTLRLWRPDSDTRPDAGLRLIAAVASERMYFFLEAAAPLTAPWAEYDPEVAAHTAFVLDVVSASGVAAVPPPAAGFGGSPPSWPQPCVASTDLPADPADLSQPLTLRYVRIDFSTDSRTVLWTTRAIPGRFEASPTLHFWRPEGNPPSEGGLALALIVASPGLLYTLMEGPPVPLVKPRFKGDLDQMQGQPSMFYVRVITASGEALTSHAGGGYGRPAVASAYIALTTPPAEPQDLLQPLTVQLFGEDRETVIWQVQAVPLPEAGK